MILPVSDSSTQLTLSQGSPHANKLTDIVDQSLKVAKIKKSEHEAKLQSQIAKIEKNSDLEAGATVISVISLMVFYSALLILPGGLPIGSAIVFAYFLTCFSYVVLFTNDNDDDDDLLEVYRQAVNQSQRELKELLYLRKSLYTTYYRFEQGTLIPQSLELTGIKNIQDLKKVMANMQKTHREAQELFHKYELEEQKKKRIQDFIKNS